MKKKCNVGNNVVKFSKNIKTAIRLLVIGALAVAAVIIVWHKLGPYHFKTVKPGVLYRGGTQELYNLAFLTNRYHFKTIVSLRVPDEDGWFPDWYKAEKEFCQKRGIRFYNIPIRGKEPPSTEQVQQWLEIMEDQDQYPVFVHCAHGVVRTGVMVALYKIAIEHKDNRSVWEQLPRLGHDFTKPSMQWLKEFILHFEPSQIQDPSARRPLPKKREQERILKNKEAVNQKVDRRRP